MQKVMIGLGIVAAIAALMVCLVPLKEVAYDVTVDYEDTETYYESEPYEDIEIYYEDVRLEYAVVDSYLSTDTEWEGQGVVPSDIPIRPLCCAEIQNVDTLPGTFDVEFSFTVSHVSISGGHIRGWVEPYQASDELYLEPGITKTASHSFSEVNMNSLLKTDGFSWNYDITPPTKQVEKQRTITKYRQVEKQRTVINQRQEIRYEKVTLLDYLLHY
jgi:hypothetical protein